MKLGDFKALSFDVYGTLIDWETGMIEALQPLIEKAGNSLSRNEILQAHARLESLHQSLTPARPYQALLSTVYQRLADEWGVAVDREECLVYGQSIKNWPPFPDSVDALRYLKKHYKLFVLSNVDNESFVYSKQKLGVAFDGVFTAEDIGAYKPDSRNFEYMLRVLEERGIGKDQLLHTAESMFHDHEPANHRGLASCHIFRRHQQKGFGATMVPQSMPNYDFRFNSMAEMVEAHRAESV